MARKKKTEMVTYQIDTDKLSMSEDKYVGQLRQFLEERIDDCKIDKDGKKLIVNVPKNVNLRLLKQRADKFLYQSGLKLEYRLVSMQNKGIQGYQIMNR